MVCLAMFWLLFHRKSDPISGADSESVDFRSVCICPFQVPMTMDLFRFSTMQNPVTEL